MTEINREAVARMQHGTVADYSSKSGPQTPKNVDPAIDFYQKDREARQQREDFSPVKDFSPGKTARIVAIFHGIAILGS